MNPIKLITKSLVYYWRKNLAVGLGVAISTAILTGALIVGDSMQHSMQQMVNQRLGPISHTLTAGDRYFTSGLAKRIEKGTNLQVLPVLQLESSAVLGGGQKRLPKVQVFGVDSQFDSFFDLNPFYGQLEANEVIVSTNLAEKLEVAQGEWLLFRIRKASLIPLNAPFVSDEETTVSMRLQVKAIADNEQMGRLNLYNSQTAPVNAFISLSRLNEVMKLNDKVNTLFIQGREQSVQQLMTAVQKGWRIADLGLSLKTITGHQSYEITSDRVFIDTVLSQALQQLPWPALPIMTYFVNSINYDTSTTPYSFVSTLPDDSCAAHEVVINEWLAKDLQVEVGDELNLDFYQVGPLRRLLEKSIDLEVSSIKRMNGYFADHSLAPDLPGLSDAGNCRDWETGVPIDLESIRDRDEDYWDEWKGTPKGFISYSLAQELWSNRFGNLTAVRYADVDIIPEQFENELRTQLEIDDLGFEIKDVHTIGSDAAKRGVNFGELFLGLSFFVLAAAVLLSVLLYRLSISERSEQLHTLRALGLSKTRIQWILLAELSLVAFIGAGFGLVLAWVYNLAIFNALNGIWQDIVRSDLISLHLNTATLVLGMVISVIITLISIIFVIDRRLKKDLVDLKRARSHRRTRRFMRLEGLLTVVLALAIMVLLAGQMIRQEVYNPGVFFISGALVLVFFLLAFDQFLYRKSTSLSCRMGFTSLAWKNMTRYRSRTYSILLLLALGTFLIVTVGANRKSFLDKELGPSSGTGGFAYFGELTVPFLQDINDPMVRQAFVLEADQSIVQFRAVDGDDASCLNLNAINQPRILGVDPQQLTGHFSFATRHDLIDEDNPWLGLNTEMGPNVIPGIADQTVIQWSLLKEIGDTLWYTDQLGKELGIVLVGGLNSSIFQGNLLISESHFLKHFPSSSGSQVLLVETEEKQAGEVADELNMGLRDFGLFLQSTRERLAEFASVTNTYLAIFLLLGALGLLIGTFGLGIILIRTIQERSIELGIQRAIGIPKQTNLLLLIYEFGLLMIGGIVIGSVSAILAIFPSIISPGAEINLPSILLLVGIILVNGLLWISVFATLSQRKENLNTILRSE